jgi:hypothetical protein
MTADLMPDATFYEVVGFFSGLVGEMGRVIKNCGVVVGFPLVCLSVRRRQREMVR